MTRRGQNRGENTMSSLFDDVSRAIASPVSRREMLGTVGAALGGAMLAALGLQRPALGQETQTPGSSSGCPKGTPKGYTSCGSHCCDPGNVCCNGVCCEPKQTCCGGKCCPAGMLCCGVTCCNTREAVCLHSLCCETGVVCAGKCCLFNEDCVKGSCKRVISPTK